MSRGDGTEFPVDDFLLFSELFGRLFLGGLEGGEVDGFDADVLLSTFKHPLVLLSH